MSDDRMNMDVIADGVPRLPDLEDVPQVMILLGYSRLNEEETAWLIEAIGGTPHCRVRERWLDTLIHTPRAQFPGGPLWYQYTGHASVRVNDAVCDERANAIGRRLVEPGEKICVQTWKYVGATDWTRIDDPTTPASQPKIRKAKHAQPSA